MPPFPAIRGKLGSGIVKSQPLPTVTARDFGGRPGGALVLPARLCAAAAGNYAHCYIGKICCLLLVRAEYIGRAPGRGPEGTGNCSSCYGVRTNFAGPAWAAPVWPCQEQRQNQTY